LLFASENPGLEVLQFSLWGRNGLDGGCEALAAYRVRRRLVKQVANKTNANNEFALAA